MYFIRCGIIITMISWISSVFAIGEPLVVGIETFDPPFIIQEANQEIYGFDIDMMNKLCKLMGRSCQFRVMKFEQLLPAVANNTVEVAVSSLTITNERSKIVSFSLPYLLSNSRFLGTRKTQNQTFSLDLVNNKKIGIETGSIFADQIVAMGIKNPVIKEYSGINNLLVGLGNGEVDFALVDNSTALYWEANSASAFKTIGQPYLYGNGLGIAVNRNNQVLLQNINRSLLQYQNSKGFKLDYNKYISRF